MSSNTARAPGSAARHRQATRWVYFTIFNLTVAFFPLTTLLASNPEILTEPVTTELLVLVGFFFLVFLLNQAVYLLFRRERIHVLFYFAIFLLFLWNPILDLVQRDGILGAGVFLGVVSGAFVLGLWVTRSAERTQILAFMLFVFAVIPIGRIVVSSITGPAESLVTERPPDDPLATTAAGAVVAPKLTPSVYLLIFDCMTSTDLFLEHIDSSERSRSRIEDFHRKMRALGYAHLPESWSNYERTIPSMFSFFNFDYHVWDSYRWNLKYYGFRNSLLLNDFKRLGYRIVASERDIPCPDEFDHCYRMSNQFELVSMLASATPTTYLISRLDRRVFTPLGSNLLRKAAATLRTTKLQEVSEFLEYVENKPTSGRPEFTYAHFFASHPPNYYDENCETEDIALFEQRSGESPADERFFGRYAAEYFCFLKQLENVAEAIGKKDPEAWVLVLSDHGYGAQRFGVEPGDSWDRRRLDATFRILSLAKTSPWCERELGSQKSSVNKARAIVNCLSEAPVRPYLPDQVDLRYVGLDRRLTILPDGYAEADPASSGG